MIVIRRGTAKEIWIVKRSTIEARAVEGKNVHKSEEGIVM